MSETADHGGARHRGLWLALRLLGTTAGLTYVAFIVDLGQVAATLTRIPLTAFAMALTMSGLSVVVSAARWRVMFRTYGAADIPAYSRLLKLQLVGLFYSTYLPGGVGGDLVRGVASRQAFGASGTPAALTVVFVERLVGLAGLLALVSAALALRPLPGVRTSAVVGVTGLIAATGAVLAVAAARRLAPLIPGRLGAMVARVPTMEWPAGLPLALALSMVAQLAVALGGHSLLDSVAPGVTLSDTTVVVLVSIAASFFPLAVGGAGVREATLVVLCAAILNVPENDAAAASLGLWLCQLIVAGSGGLLQLISRSER